MNGYLKNVSLQEFVKRDNRLTVKEGVDLGNGDYLLPWLNGYAKIDINDSRSIGWHDPRFYLPKREIKVHNDLYILDTSMEKIVEAQKVIWHRVFRKGPKSPEERLKYLLGKEPTIRKIDFFKGVSAYTPAFGSFIVSISPTHYLHFNEDNKEFACGVAKNFYDVMKDISEGRDPLIRANMNSYLRKN